MELDLIINQLVQESLNHFLISFFSFITFFGSVYFILISTLILIIYLILKKELYKANFSILLISISAILIDLIKILVHRSRPENSLIELNSYAFPSGHATISTIFFLLIIFLFKDNFKKILIKNLFIFLNILIILLVGISRIILSVHWFTDVLAGWFLGIIIFYLSLYFYSKYKYNLD